MKTGGAGRWRISPFGIVVLVLVAATGVALRLAYLPWRWERTKETLRKRYPSINRIDLDGLTEWLTRPGGTKPVLIDVRPPVEYEFSHLPGAKRMDRDATPVALGFPEDTNESVVIYDAVGTDAFPVANTLVKRGYRHVQVLEGGVFEWANRGRQLTGRDGNTGMVLTGNSELSPLLKSRVRAKP
jgi:rhodanese-related sulfurtransferase